jgi:hypothetical protein
MKKRVFGLVFLAAVVGACSVGGLAWNADFDPSTFNPDVDQSVTFSVCEPCLDSGSYRYVWDFDGDGSVDLETEDLVVEHAFGEAGFYETELMLIDADGRRNSKRKGILVGAQPAYAVREVVRQGDGSLFVLITIRVNALVSAPGIEEAMPRGRQFELVDDGGAMAANPNAAARVFEVIWGSLFDTGSELSFSYRLHPAGSVSSTRLSGPLSGRSGGKRFVAEICGELEVDF